MEKLSRARLVGGVDDRIRWFQETEEIPRNENYKRTQVNGKTLLRDWPGVFPELSNSVPSNCYCRSRPRWVSLARDEETHKSKRQIDSVPLSLSCS